MQFEIFENVKIKGIGKSVTVECHKTNIFEWISFSFCKDNVIYKIDTDYICRVCIISYKHILCNKFISLFYEGKNEPFTMIDGEKRIDAQLKRYCNTIDRILSHFNYRYKEILQELEENHTLNI